MSSMILENEYPYSDGTLGEVVNNDEDARDDKHYLGIIGQAILWKEDADIEEEGVLEGKTDRVTIIEIDAEAELIGEMVAYVASPKEARSIVKALAPYIDTPDVLYDMAENKYGFAEKGGLVNYKRVI